MATTDLDVTSVIENSGWTNATASSLLAIDSDVATDGTVENFISVEITNAPGDFGSQNSIQLHAHAFTSGAGSRTKQLVMELRDSAENILETHTTGDLTTTPTTYSSAVWTRSDSQSVIDGYRYRITITEGGGMPDSVVANVDRMWGVLDYELGVTFTPEMQGFRIYDDDAAEDSSTPLGAENTDVSVSIAGGDAAIQLRALIAETAGAGGAAGDDWRLQVSKNSGAYVDVTSVSANVRASFQLADAFAGAQAGAAYDIARTDTLWKDTAGTDPVTADGDAVARVDDLSGNDNHWLQGTAGDQPLYRTSGGLHWLEVDGAGDNMAVGSTVAALSPDLLLMAAREYVSGAETGERSLNEWVVNLTNRFAIGCRQASERLTIRTRSDSLSIGQVVSESDDNAYPADAAAVIEGHFLAGTNEGYVNGVSVLTSSTANGWAADDSVAGADVTLRESSIANKFFGGVAIDEIPSDQMLTNLRRYLAERCGVTL